MSSKPPSAANLKLERPQRPPAVAREQSINVTACMQQFQLQKRRSSSSSSKKKRILKAARLSTGVCHTSTSLQRTCVENIQLASSCKHTFVSTAQLQLAKQAKPPRLQFMVRKLTCKER
jgi:hypothetical protein